MSDAAIRKELRGINVQDLIDQQRRLGRAGLPASALSALAGLHDRSGQWLADERNGRDVRRAARLVHAVTNAPAMLHRDRIPTYYSYADISLLEWFIGDTHQRIADLKRRAADGIYYALLDLLRFEAESLTAVERYSRKRVGEDVIGRRLPAIKDAVAAAVEAGRSIGHAVDGSRQDLIHYGDIEAYAAEPSRLSAMVHFSCMPRTEFHDEALFIRTIHVSEFCFFAIRTILIEAIEEIRAHRVGRAAECLAQAALFGRVLYRVFRVLRTMPPRHFEDFRAATGQSSAIQSRGYQTMELYFSGYNPKKAEVFARIPHLRDLNRFAHSAFLHLGALITQGWEQAEDGERKAAYAAAKVLDQQLLTWRGLHLAFAIEYLPKGVVGTGATEGAPYLQSHLKTGLFTATEIDWDELRLNFPGLFKTHPELPDKFRVRPGFGITPPSDVPPPLAPPGAAEGSADQP